MLSFVSDGILKGGTSTLSQKITKVSHFCREFKALYPNCILVSNWHKSSKEMMPKR